MNIQKGRSKYSVWSLKQRRNTHAWNSEAARDKRVRDALAAGILDEGNAPRQLSEAYDIKNVDFRNLLTVAVGTLSNQTGEAFDSALSRGKCADEILRRYNELKAIAQSVIDEATDGIKRSEWRLLKAREALNQWEAAK